MLLDHAGSKILDLNKSPDRSRPAPCWLLLDHCCRIQRSLKPRKPRRQNGLLLNGLQVVIVATDLAEPAGLMAGLMEAGRELDVKLMPQPLNRCAECLLALTGSACSPSRVMIARVCGVWGSTPDTAGQAAPYPS